MKVLGIILTISLIIPNSMQEECPLNEFANEDESLCVGCIPEPNICAITCGLTSGVACTILSAEEDDSSCANAKVPGTLNTEEVDTSDACKELCEKSKGDEDVTKRCRFWHYEEIAHTGKTCSLMKEGQCTVFQYCNVDGGHCACADQGCPKVPEPEPQTCTGEITFDSDKIHWACINEENPNANPNPYTSDPVPGETVCTTISRCENWKRITNEEDGLWRKLRVKCGKFTGQWEWDANAGGKLDDYNDVIISGDKPGFGDQITEPTCMGKQVSFPKSQLDAGSQLLCDNGYDISPTPPPTTTVPPTTAPPTTTPTVPPTAPPSVPPFPKDGEYVVISSPNKCVLLCDYHLVYSFGSEVDPDGVVTFKDVDGALFDPAEITCWGRM